MNRLPKNIRKAIILWLLHFEWGYHIVRRDFIKWAKDPHTRNAGLFALRKKFLISKYGCI